MACSLGNISTLLKLRPFFRPRVLPVLFIFWTLPVLANSAISQLADESVEPVREDAHSVCVVKWATRQGNSPAENRELLSWCQKAADQGYAWAQTMLGNAFYNGDGIEKDFHKAILWWNKAALQNDVLAYYNLGLAYRYGKGVEKNPHTAFFWWEKAAAQDYALAQNTLGYAYEKGIGTEKNPEKALFWWKKAAV